MINKKYLEDVQVFYDRELIAHKLRRWERSLKNYRLPTWEELPTIELYMEQVISLLSQWLYFLPAEDNQGEVVTPTAINNYVRLKIMPAPNKKKYSRIHIAYLIMICTLKQSVNIAYVQKMIPMGLTEDEVRTVYSDYVAQHRDAAMYFIKQVRAHSRDIVAAEDGENTEGAVSRIVMLTAVLAGFSKLMTEKIVNLQGEDKDTVISTETPPVGEIIEKE